MGGCSSAPINDLETKENESISLLLEANKKKLKQNIKLLLLGTAESGKSTIFKQMQIIHTTEGFTGLQRNAFRNVIRRNMIECMQTLVHAKELFPDIKFVNPQTQNSVNELVNIDYITSPFFFEKNIYAIISHLWNEEPGIREVFDRRAKFQLMDSASYFFAEENLQRICDNNYYPSDMDILRARIRTSGIVERTFFIQGINFTFLDVGGQRNSRKKWIHCFEDVTAVIFVTAIQEYDQMLYEDTKENRLIESINVFEQVINNVHLSKSTIVLFLNKKDLFEEKIKNVSLKVCFSHYTGDGTYLDAADFIHYQFLQMNKAPHRKIFSHLTCATDTHNIRKVFDASRATILQQNLARLGFDSKI